MYFLSSLRRWTWTGDFKCREVKTGFFPKEMNANRFFWDSHWLEIWSNHFYPFMGPNGGSVAMDSEWRDRGYRLWPLLSFPHPPLSFLCRNLRYRFYIIIEPRISSVFLLIESSIIDPSNSETQRFNWYQSIKKFRNWNKYWVPTSGFCTWWTGSACLFPYHTGRPDMSCPAVCVWNFQLLLYSKCAQPSVINYPCLFSART